MPYSRCFYHEIREIHDLIRPGSPLLAGKKMGNLPLIYLTPSGYVYGVRKPCLRLKKAGAWLQHSKFRGMCEVIGGLLTQGGASLALGYYIQPFLGCAPFSHRDQS